MATLDILTGIKNWVYQKNIVGLDSRITELEKLIDDDPEHTTAAIDKFNEIVSFLNGVENTDTLSGLLEDIGSASANAVKYTAQSLTTELKAQARTNISAPSTDVASASNAGLMPASSYSKLYDLPSATELVATLLHYGAQLAYNTTTRKILLKNNATTPEVLSELSVDSFLTQVVVQVDELPDASADTAGKLYLCKKPMYEVDTNAFSASGAINYSTSTILLAPNTMLVLEIGDDSLSGKNVLIFKDSITSSPVALATNRTTYTNPSNNTVELIIAIADTILTERTLKYRTRRVYAPGVFDDYDLYLGVVEENGTYDWQRISLNQYTDSDIDEMFTYYYKKYDVNALLNQKLNTVTLEQFDAIFPSN